MNGNDTFLDVNNAHLRVTSGNVYASAFNLDQIDIVMSSNTASTVNFNNPTKAFNAASNIEVGTANLFVDTTTTRVGVGTTSPATTLDVAGDVNVSGNLTILGTTTTLDTDHLRVQDPIIELGKDNTASPVVDLGLLMTRPAGTSNVGIIFDESTDTLEIGYTQGNASDSTITMDSTPLSVNVNGDLSVTSNVEVGTANLFVDTVNSRVGVGTSSPDNALHIRSSIPAVLLDDSDDNTKVRITGGTGGDLYVDSNWGGSGNTGDIIFREASSEKMRITGSGNVGIGTTSPDKKLHIYTTGSESNTQLVLESADRYATMQMSDNSGGVLIGNDQGDLRLLTGYDASMAGGSEVMRIKGSGNVGIGTTSPGRTLDIEGSFQVAPGNGTSFETNGQKVSSPNDNTNSGTTNHFATMSVTLSRYTTQTSRPIYFGSGDDTDTTFVIGTTGGLGGAGFTNTNLKLTGASYLYVKRVYANGSQLSDDRLKINEEPIKNATKTILKLKPLVYDKYEKLGELTSNVFEVESGLMVQDVWYDTPELRHIVDVPDDAKPTETKEEDPEYTSWGSKPAYLAYTQLLPYIIKSIQEIHNEKGKLKLDYYGSGIDIDTHRGMIICNHPTVHLCNNERDPTCVGVLSDIDTNEVLLKTRGIGNVWIINTNGNLNAGDYITTSIVSGYGQKQNSEFLANYTVAKILEPCNFTETTKPVKRAIKRLEDVTYYVIHKKILINEELYNGLPENERHIETFTSVEDTITDYYKLLRTESKHFREGAETITRQELVNVLDEHGQIQWEDDPSGATEPAYKIRYLDADGNITNEANHVYKAAFIGCTYHCG